MSKFNAVEFVGNPSIEELKVSKVSKDDLKYIAKTFNIPFSADDRKSQLMTLVLTHLGATKEDFESFSIQPLTPQGAAALNMTGAPDAQLLLEVEKVKMESLRMQLEFQAQEKEQEREYQAQEKERERQHELELLRHPHPSRQVSDKLSLTKFIKLIPVFSENNPEAFFKEFESVAKHFEIPASDWVWLIKPKLVGKAIKAYEGIENNTDYEEVKKAVLSAYAITTEGYRQAFRSLTFDKFQTIFSSK